MREIKVKCPAKINLTLEIVNKREDGFHNIKSIMQTISLYDYLTIKTEEAENLSINLSGTSEEIPYNEKNLVYKAADLFVKESGIKNTKLDIHIKKNIPVAAGLAGGSTDAAGTLYGLNHLTKHFDNKKLNELCAKLGSDLNVCLNGGCVLATSRGEITEPLNFIESDVTLIKPRKLGISAKEAYTKYSLKQNKPKFNYTEKMIKAINNNSDIQGFLYNDLEYAVFNDYSELQMIKTFYPNSVMSGSGSTYFILDNIEQNLLGDDFLIINNLKFINDGVSLYL